MGKVVIEMDNREILLFSYFFSFTDEGLPLNNRSGEHHPISARDICLRLS